MQELHQYSGFYLGLGIALVVLGIIGIVWSVTVTLVSVVFLGVLLIVGGVVQAGHAFGSRSWSGFFTHLLAAILYVVVGCLAVTRPAIGAISLTLLLAAFFLVGGLYKFFGALFTRFPSWGWVMLNGVIEVILGILIAAQWPISGLWVIGMFIGIDLLLSGWSFIMLGTTTRSLLSQPAT
jgi:uncharacterized membrane protein HdeD (DUF308 family)